MKELGGAEVGGTVRSRRAGEVEMLFDWARRWRGGGPGRAGGGKGPEAPAACPTSSLQGALPIFAEAGWGKGGGWRGGWWSAAQAAGAGDWEAPDGVHEGAGRRRGWRHG